MCNQEIRDAAKKNGVKLWQVADRIGMNDSNFSKKLRKELPDHERMEILAIITDINSENGGDLIVATQNAYRARCVG